MRVAGLPTSVCQAVQENNVDPATKLEQSVEFILRLEMSSVCVLCSVFAFCVMLGARRMLGATENMEFNNIY